MMGVAHAYARDTGFARRALILSVVFGLAACLALVMSNAQLSESAPRYPTAEAAFAQPGWSVAPATVEGRPGVAFVTRRYARADGLQAEVGITTSPQAKLVYRAGADVPFLGNGFSVAAAPADLVPAQANREATLARRGTEAWLQIAAFGERRGLFGAGGVGWGLAIFDTALGRSNDYYLLRVLVPFESGHEQDAAGAARELADSLFPRLTAWYAE